MRDKRERETIIIRPIAPNLQSPRPSLAMFGNYLGIRSGGASGDKNKPGPKYARVQDKATPSTRCQSVPPSSLSSFSPLTAHRYLQEMHGNGSLYVRM